MGKRFGRDEGGNALIEYVVLSAVLLGVAALWDGRLIHSASNTFQASSDTNRPVVPWKAHPLVEYVGLTSDTDTGDLGDNLTSNSWPKMIFHAKPGATIQVVRLEDNTPRSTVGRIVADQQGNAVGQVSLWAQSNGVGITNAVAVATAPDGTVAKSEPFTVIWDSIPPAIPTITQSYIDPPPPAGRGLTRDNLPAFAGTAEPDARMDLYSTDANGKGIVVGTSRADMRGNWYIQATTPIIDGSHTLGVYAIDRAGNMSNSGATFSITVDTTPPVFTMLRPIGSSTMFVYMNENVVGQAARSDFVLRAGPAGSLHNVAVTGVGSGNAQSYFSISVGETLTSTWRFELTYQPSQATAGKLTDEAGNAAQTGFVAYSGS